MNLNLTAINFSLDLNNYIQQQGQFFLIAGPCVIEDREVAHEIAQQIKEICVRLGIPYVFKASYKKANRTRLDSFTGIGNLKALEIIKEVGETYDIPTLTDIHESSDAQQVSQYVDVLQIPAFLVRQTDLIVSAASTGKWINLKKGQFMSPQSMKYAVRKVRESRNDNVMVTDRGTQFGYQDLVVDFRGLPTIQKFAPVVMDLTHSLQQPNSNDGVTGGLPHLIETIGRAAIAVGVDGIFLETHPNPLTAKSDGENMLNLSLLEGILYRLNEIRRTICEIDKTNKVGS